MAGLDFDAIGDNEEKETETEAAMLDQEGEEEVKKKTHKKKTPEPKTRAERLALIAKPTDTELESDKDLVVARVKQLQRAMQKKDKGQITAILDKVAEAARHHYGPKIWGVAPLKTDGFAFKGSMRQERLKGSTTALTKTPLSFSAEGKSVAEIREQSKALCIPNPTDQVLGIDEYTELRLALEAANETRTLPITVNNNRDLAKIAKTAIGDMLVPEDVAVRWWLTKKREERAKQKARKEAGRKQLILDHATMDFLLAKMDAESAGEVFDADKAEEKAMRKATHFYTLSRVEEKKRLLKAARASGVPLTGPLVKPKGIKRTSIVKRRGPRRALYKKPKVIKVVGKGKTPNSKGKRKLGFGSQRQKRSGVSGGSTGASRHKKRRGK